MRHPLSGKPPINPRNPLAETIEDIQSIKYPKPIVFAKIVVLPSNPPFKELSMTALIRQLQPAWFQIQQLELPLPPNALRNTLLALGAGVLLMAGLVAGSTFWAPTRWWWDATGASSAMTAGVQASLIAALATAVGPCLCFWCSG